MAKVVFLLLKMGIMEGLFPAMPWLSLVCRTHPGAQKVHIMPTAQHLLRLVAGRLTPSGVGRGISYGERACKSFFHLPCGRALFSHSFLGCPLEPNPFVRAPQQETCRASNTCQTVYSYSNRGLEREMLSSGNCTGNSA